jgi:hypothetical protein
VPQKTTLPHGLGGTVPLWKNLAFGIRSWVGSISGGGLAGAVNEASGLGLIGGGRGCCLD